MVAVSVVLYRLLSWLRLRQKPVKQLPIRSILLLAPRRGEFLLWDYRKIMEAGNHNIQQMIWLEFISHVVKKFFHDHYGKAFPQLVD